MKKVTKPQLRYMFLYIMTIILALAGTMVFAGVVIWLLLRFRGELSIGGIILLFIALVSVILGIVISTFASSAILVPMRRMSAAAKAVAGGDYKVRLQEGSKIKEVHEMALNFNLMAEELASTELIHSDFTRNVSHELKTPLSTIEGYAMLLQTPEISEEKRRDYAGKIVESCRRLTSLTGNILELSGLENKKAGIEKNTFSLSEQLRQVVLQFEKDWTEKEQEIDIDIPDVLIVGNRDMLFQVWQNIIGNAVKFTDRGGVIRIRLEVLQGVLLVSVADNGIGMEMKDQKRIFEKFYQADQSHSGNGNGLGLAIARQIVELHGGSIAVESRLGEGTKFTVTLPAADHMKEKE